MQQDVHNLAQVVQVLQLDEGGAKHVVQHHAQGVHEGRQRPALLLLSREEVLEQLALQLAHLSRHSHV